MGNSDIEVLSSASYRVLIVEDDYLQSSELEEMLAHAGYDSVGPLRTGAAALAAIKFGKIDAALLDLNLSGEMAFAVADALVAKGIPFIIVSGYSQKVMPAKYRKHRAFQKPVREQELIESLAQIFQPSRRIADRAG